MRAIAFVTPPERAIDPRVAPSTRYIGLLLEGCRDWGIDEGYAGWLQRVAASAVDQRERGPEYYTGLGGKNLPAWPKVRTGSDGGKGAGRKKRGKRGWGERGRGSSAAGS